MTILDILFPLLLLGIVLGPVLYSNIKEYKTFSNSSYKVQTGNSYLKTLWDKGKYGEFLTYSKLRYWEETGAKFLYNIYVPTASEKTTEIDLLLITHKGIFVFESKNYSGWIFGNERQTQWTQTLCDGRSSQKNHFYNPIMQNNGHIKHLKNIIGTATPVYSVIVFSERCTLKNVSVYSPSVRVVKRTDIAHAVNSIAQTSEFDFLNDEQITQVYEKLLPFSQVTETVKQQHIDNIKNH